MKKIFIVLGLLVVFLSSPAFAQKEPTGVGGTVPENEIVNYRKIIVETLDGKKENMPIEALSSGTVPADEIMYFKKIEIETDLGQTIEFKKYTGVGGTVPEGERVDFKKDIIVDTSETISIQNKKIYVAGDEVKIMPKEVIDSIEKKLGNTEILKIELKKDVAGNSGQSLKYEVSSNQEVKIIGIFKKNMAIKSTVDAQTGSVVKVEKPWWKLFAF